MNKENYPNDVALCFEEQLLLHYDHYLLAGITSLSKVKGHFNNLPLSNGVKTAADISDEEEEQREETQKNEADTSEPGTFLM